MSQWNGKAVAVPGLTSFHIFSRSSLIRLNCMWKSCGGSSVHQVSIVVATAFPGVLYVTAQSLAHMHT